MTDSDEPIFLKLNCWEYKKCGRELGGANARRYGICPASIDIEHDGANDGICAGRACWIVAGTLCGGIVMGSFAKKYRDCTRCDFYKMVEQEEGSDFLMIEDLLAFDNRKFLNRLTNRGYDLNFLKPSFHETNMTPITRTLLDNPDVRLNDAE